MDETLLSRIEDASLNASAAPQQWWMDGWIVRASPSKAKRSRCINAVAQGRQPLEEKLPRVLAVYRQAGLTPFLRITRYTQPAGLDTALADRGWSSLDDTRVLVRLPTPASTLPPEPDRPLPAGTHWAELEAAEYAEAVGALRQSPVQARQAQAQRLLACPVRYRGYAIRRDADGAVLCCGQFAREGDLVGLYDVYTREDARGQGLAALLCQRLLSISMAEGGLIAYLQVEADNAPAWSVYRRLGFVEGYRYHYRQAPAA